VFAVCPGDDSKSPKSTPERLDGDKDNDEVDESDPPLNLDDNKLMTPPVSGGDEEEETKRMTFLVLTNFLYNFDVYDLHGHRLYHSILAENSNNS
jgi:hypothetical protein